MAFSFSTRAAHTALASAAMLVLSLVAVPAAQAYNPDIDGDGIGNILEMRGYDGNRDGKLEIDYPGMGANPLKKDLFVEMDYMPGLLASEEELDRITEIFANMPIRNPNGTTGINLHLPVTPAAPSTTSAVVTKSPTSNWIAPWRSGTRSEGLIWTRTVDLPSTT